MNKLVLLNNLKAKHKDKTHFITYGDVNYINSKKRILKEAKKSGFFATYQGYGTNDLSKDFVTKYSDILKEPVGGGYWIWKLDIILSKLSKIRYGEFLIYLDCGCSIKKDGIKRLNYYLDLLNNSKFGIISFQLEEIEREWTIKEIFNFFNVSLESKIAKSGQYIGGVLIMQKKPHLLKLLNIYKSVIEKNTKLITDYYSNVQKKFFKYNRHDQSIFSIIRKIHNSIVLSDETFKNNKNKVPFLATRLK